MILWCSLPMLMVIIQLQLLMTRSWEVHKQDWMHISHLIKLAIHNQTVCLWFVQIQLLNQAIAIPCSNQLLLHQMKLGITPILLLFFQMWFNRIRTDKFSQVQKLLVGAWTLRWTLMMSCIMQAGTNPTQITQMWRCALQHLLLKSQTRKQNKANRSRQRNEEANDVWLKLTWFDHSNNQEVSLLTTSTHRKRCSRFYSLKAEWKTPLQDVCMWLGSLLTCKLEC